MNISQEDESPCPQHSAFRCGVCYPGRFDTPSVTIRCVPPESDPSPRMAVLIKDDAGNDVYISSDQVDAIAMMMGIVCGYEMRK